MDQHTATAATAPSNPDSVKTNAPLLSIGLPVFNGAVHLRDSLESLLAQTVSDLELIITDNDSTDDTAAICLEYASKDDRVRYLRNEENIGSAANFNRVFELSVGQYFMWASHDDIWDSRFAEACIARLERSPRAVTCTSQVALISQDGSPWTGCDYVSLDTEGLPVEAKVHAFITQPLWLGTYSVIRPGALRRTRMHLPTFAMDVRLQLELLLLGDAVTVQETLLSYRMPDTGKTATEYLTDIAPARTADETGDDLREPWSYLARELLEVVRAAGLDEDTILRIEADFVQTLTLENTTWRTLILRERGFERADEASTSEIRAQIASALALPYYTDADALREDPWLPRDGMRLAGIRKLLLRLLQPFTDRQNELGREHSDAIELLGYRIDWLRRRLQDLETEQARRDETGSD